MTCVFVSIRQEWDMYAVRTSSETGSRIPQGWVIPVEPTDEVWASALKHWNHDWLEWGAV